MNCWMRTLTANRSLNGAALRVAVSAAVGLYGWSVGAADPAPTEIAAKLRETLTSLHTLEFEYRRTVTRANGETFVNEGCKWLRSGELVQLTIPPGGLPGGQWAFDGRRSYKVGWDRERAGFPNHIITGVTPPWQLQTHLTPDLWLGLRLKGPPGTIADHLAKNQGRVTGEDLWGGLQVYNVELGAFGGGENALKWTAVLCPARDWLPVRITGQPLKQNSSAAGPAFNVKEFRVVEDGLLRTQKWVPWSMDYEMAGLHEVLEVTAVRINPAVPVKLAVAKPQPGTQLIDETIPGARKVKAYMPNEAMKRHAVAVAHDLASRRPQGAAGADSAVARPPDLNRKWVVVRWAGAVALLAAAVVYFYRVRTSM